MHHFAPIEDHNNSFDDLKNKLTKAGFSVVTIMTENGPEPFIYCGGSNIGFLEHAESYDSWEIIATTPTGFTLLKEAISDVTLWAWYGTAMAQAKDLIHAFNTHQT